MSQSFGCLQWPGGGRMVLRAGTASRKFRQGITVDFQVAARDSGEVIVIDASGRLTLGAGGTKLRDLLHVFVSKGRKKFALNLAEVTLIDSFGIGELVRSHAIVRTQGGELILFRVNKKVHDLLEITRLHMLFEIHADEHTALGKLRERG